MAGIRRRLCPVANAEEKTSLPLLSAFVSQTSVFGNTLLKRAGFFQSFSLLLGKAGVKRIGGAGRRLGVRWGQGKRCHQGDSHAACNRCCSANVQHGILFFARSRYYTALLFVRANTAGGRDALGGACCRRRNGGRAGSARAAARVPAARGAPGQAPGGSALTRYCAKGFRLSPDQPDIMNIPRFSDDERRKLTQHWAVAESERLMKFVEESTNLRSRAGRADQVAESLKEASRYLFPHEMITNAMRAVTQYQEALEGILELPEDQRAAAAEGARTLLAPYFTIIEELKRENQELARVAWPGARLREILARLEKA